MSKAFLNSAAMLSCRIFLDSDGVFADFDTRCEHIFGGEVPKKGKEFWEDFMGDGGFSELPLMPFAEELEPLLHLPNSRVLTGTPRDPFAAPAARQKREWYGKHFGLGPEQVITCLSYQKAIYAKKSIGEGLTPILIDDNAEAREGWEMVGGIFIHYPRPGSRLDTVACLQALDDLVHFAHFWRTVVCAGGGGTYMGYDLDLQLYKRLHDMVTAEDYQLARVIGRESNNFWPCVEGVRGLLAQCKQELAKEAEAAELAKPLVTGKELMAIGFKPGPKMGKVLKAVKAAQDEGERDKEVLLKMAKEYSVE